MYYILLIVLGYFLGSIPFSYLIPKWVAKIDIRSVGSGNTGTTNVVRTLGLKVGVLAFIGDFLKGIIPTALGLYLIGFHGALLGGAMAVIGHCFSVWLKFKGGKGIATSAGVLLVCFPLIVLILIIWQFTVIFATKFMSLASISSAVLFPILVILFHYDLSAVFFAICLGVFIIYRHKANIIRLIHGEEKKLTVAKSTK